MLDKTMQKRLPFGVYRSPAWHLAVIAVSIFVAETGVMAVLSRFSDVPGPVLFILDSTLLLVLLFPCLYFLVLKPMTKHMDERKRAEDELHRLLEQLRNLSCHLQSAREKERGRIAREIHDELGQSLTAMKMNIVWLSRQLPGALSAKGQEMSIYLDDIIRTVQRISTELRPGMLDDLGLTAAIEWQAQKFGEWSGIDCETIIDCEDGKLDSHWSTSLFRIVQEALTNAARHSGATRTRVKLSEGGGTLHLKITDNGRGIEARALSAPESVGLAGIRERVLSCGGSLRLRGIPGRGTGIDVTIPLHADGER